ncbi:MAG: M15 family metallopeptidase, partial [Lachnospiraceae bacterium]|nr:M15 family metallopeptidase [Lachnospiraceae bacterium]
MKKYSKLLAIPAALWALSLSLALPAGGCNRSTPGSEPIVTGTDESAHTKNITPAVTPGEGQSGTQTLGEADKDVAATATPEATLTPTATPEPTEAPTPTPITVNTDTSTITYLVNREYPLPEGFVPEGLTTPDVLFPFSDTSIDKAKMTPEAGNALALLFDAAYDEAKLTLYGVSAYRSYARQYTIYATNLVTQGIARTNCYSAAPGRSEHQTGLAIDISCASEGFGLETTFA